MDETLVAIGGVQLTVAGMSLFILFDSAHQIWPFALLSVLIGSYIVAKQLFKAR